MANSRNSRPINVRGLKTQWETVDNKLARVVPRGHRFTFFRVGEDVCAKCGKTKKEHKK